MSRTRRSFCAAYRARFDSPWKVDGWSHATVGSVFNFNNCEIVFAGKEWWADPITHPLGKRRLKRLASSARRNAGKAFILRELSKD